MVTMLQRAARMGATTPVTSRSATRMWALLIADLVTVVWMHAVGPWLDRTSPLTATATLGGNHLVVLALAAIGFAVLATLALLTEGFTMSNPTLTLAKNAACIISAVALAGLLAFILAALLSRVVFGRFLP